MTLILGFLLLFMTKIYGLWCDRKAGAGGRGQGAGGAAAILIPKSVSPLCLHVSSFGFPPFSLVTPYPSLFMLSLMLFVGLHHSSLMVSDAETSQIFPQNSRLECFCSIHTLVSATLIMLLNIT